MEVLLSELYDTSICFYLCFASEGYVLYLKENLDLLDFKVIRALISGVESILEVSDNCTFYDLEDMSISNSVSSTISFTDTTFSDIEIGFALFHIFRSHIDLTLVTITDIRKQDGTLPQIVLLNGESSSNITMTNFTDINFGIFKVFYSWINIQSSTISNVSAPNYIFHCYNGHNIILRNFTISDSGTTDQEAMFDFWDCSVDSITNSTFTNTQPAIAKFGNSHLLEFDSNVMDGMNKGFVFTNGATGSITNSVVTNMVQYVRDGDTYTQEVTNNGAAIDIKNAHVEVINCTFSNCQAVNGGAIYVECDYDNE